MHLLSCACAPVYSSTFRNLKTIERVLGNVILDVTRFVENCHFGSKLNLDTDGHCLYIPARIVHITRQ